MAYTEHKSSADLQREVDTQRSRMEDTIDQIQDKLSPGQLVDELLAYTMGGGDFVSTLQRQVTSNPLPVALLGVSLAWLMAKPASASPAPSDESDKAWDRSINRNRGFAEDAGDDDEADNDDYPVMIITGNSMRRVGHSTDDRGRKVASFADEAGRNFRALSDESGNRAGHFVDEAGNRFRGFSDAAGARIEHFRDEAGNMLDDAGGWASHTWEKAREKLDDVRASATERASAGRHRAGDAAGALQDQIGMLNQTVLTQFRDQPLVGGGLAFALGAALGSALPHTASEDALMGEQADAAKSKLGETASDFYDLGKEKVAEVYSDASERVGAAYEQAHDEVSDAIDKAPTGGSDRA